MQQWFNNLQRQEQLMLLGGGFAVALYIVFVLILGPMSKSADVLTLQNERATESLHNVQALAEEYTRLKKSGAGPTGQKQNLTRLIDSTVKKNQLYMSRFQPSSSGDVQVRFENAVFNNIITWINELESEHGTVVKDLSITKGSASGLVNVSVRLHQGV